MRQKACKQCGKVFEPQTKYTYLCQQCHSAAKTAGVVQNRVCRECGAEFSGGPRAWYCTDCRAARRRRQSATARQSTPARRIGSEDLCEVCGKPYTVNSARQKYCPDCAQEAVRQNVRAHKRQYAADKAEQMAEYKAAMSSDHHVCVICGKVFGSSVPTVTCSPECSAIRKRQHQRAAEEKRKPRKRKARKNNNDG